MSSHWTKWLNLAFVFLVKGKKRSVHKRERKGGGGGGGLAGVNSRELEAQQSLLLLHGDRDFSEQAMGLYFQLVLQLNNNNNNNEYLWSAQIQKSALGALHVKSTTELCYSYVPIEQQMELSNNVCLNSRLSTCPAVLFTVWCLFFCSAFIGFPSHQLYLLGVLSCCVSFFGLMLKK